MPKIKSNVEKLSVLVWNLWFKTQLTPDKTESLIDYINTHIQTHDPDIIGLHEVLTHRETGKSDVIDALESLGYFVDSLPGSPIRKYWLIGNAIAYKRKPLEHGNHALGPDTPAKWRGHRGYTVNLMHAVIQTKEGKRINFVLNYLAHIVPYNWRTHFIHLNNFQKFMANSKFNKRTIVVGDFNEFRWMLPLWNKRFNRRTGNRHNPTWRLHGRAPWPLQANYDNVCWDKDPLIRLTSFRVLARQPSDHAPLLAQFEIS